MQTPRLGDGRTPGPSWVWRQSEVAGERFGVRVSCPWAAVGCGVPILSAIGTVTPLVVLLHGVEGGGRWHRVAIKVEEFRGGDGLCPSTELLPGTLVPKLVKAF